MPQLSHIIKGRATLPNSNHVIQGTIVSITYGTEILYGSTDDKGDYEINIGNFETSWNIGDSLTMTASYGNRSKSESLVINSNPSQTVDFELPITKFPNYELDTQQSVIVTTDENKDKDIQYFYDVNQNPIKIVESDGKKIKTTYYIWNADGTVQIENVVIKNA